MRKLAISLILVMLLALFIPVNISASTENIYTDDNDGYLYAQGTNWNDIRGLATGTVVTDNPDIYVETSYRTSTYYIERSMLRFDTTDISSVASAKLKIWISSTNFHNDDDSSLYILSSNNAYPHELLITTDYAINRYENLAIMAEVNLTDLNQNAYNSILLDTTSIKKGDITRLIIINSLDYNNTHPTGNNEVIYKSSSADGKEPYLIIDNNTSNVDTSVDLSSIINTVNDLSTNVNNLKAGVDGLNTKIMSMPNYDGLSSSINNNLQTQFNNTNNLINNIPSNINSTLTPTIKTLNDSNAKLLAENKTLKDSVDDLSTKTMVLQKQLDTIKNFLIAFSIIFGLIILGYIIKTRRILKLKKK